MRCRLHDDVPRTFWKYLRCRMRYGSVLQRTTVPSSAGSASHAEPHQSESRDASADPPLGGLRWPGRTGPSPVGSTRRATVVGGGGPTRPRRAFAPAAARLFAIRIARIGLSDDGKWISHLAPYQNRMNIFVRPVGAPMNAAVRITNETSRDIAGYFWKGNDNLVYIKRLRRRRKLPPGQRQPRWQDNQDRRRFPKVRAEIVDGLPDDPGPSWSAEQSARPDLRCLSRQRHHRRADPGRRESGQHHELVHRSRGAGPLGGNHRRREHQPALPRDGQGAVEEGPDDFV